MVPPILAVGPRILTMALPTRARPTLVLLMLVLLLSLVHPPAHRLAVDRQALALTRLDRQSPILIPQDPNLAQAQISPPNARNGQVVKSSEPRVSWNTLLSLKLSRTIRQLLRSISMHTNDHSTGGGVVPWVQFIERRATRGFPIADFFFFLVKRYFHELSFLFPSRFPFCFRFHLSIMSDCMHFSISSS